LSYDKLLTKEKYMSEVKHLDETAFEEALAGTVPVLVDFWAEWCGPCRMVGPIVDKIASEMGDKALVCKVNVDEHPALAARFGISSIPNLKIFKGGVEVDNIVGAAPEATIKTRLETHF
jgi:thioredoxin 1